MDPISQLANSKNTYVYLYATWLHCFASDFTRRVYLLDKI
jgi:hypothetical protein